MILKLLLVIAVIAIVYFMFIKKKPLKNTKTPQKKKEEEPQSNDMVECSNCGVYTELGEAIVSGNRYFCSDECLEIKG